jgi:hypothetical protein
MAVTKRAAHAAGQAAQWCASFEAPQGHPGGRGSAVVQQCFSSSSLPVKVRLCEAERGGVQLRRGRTLVQAERVQCGSEVAVDLSTNATAMCGEAQGR